MLSRVVRSWRNFLRPRSDRTGHRSAKSRDRCGSPACGTQVFRAVLEHCYALAYRAL